MKILKDTSGKSHDRILNERDVKKIVCQPLAPFILAENKEQSINPQL